MHWAVLWATDGVSVMTMVKWLFSAQCMHSVESKRGVTADASHVTAAAERSVQRH